MIFLLVCLFVVICSILSLWGLRLFLGGVGVEVMLKCLRILWVIEGCRVFLFVVIVCIVLSRLFLLVFLSR